ncbi:O-antigen/teichoic acid export membrane protein [Nonlabens xylanidelens]|uniref:O-antigen/teichoic acid export membrane protein n=1 Tax=Nonlabens xylanidelens TaxID=191564 RepID=A0A2S6ILG0_9FLAO|nr:sugar isomerase [Nonlabens xylanidelens]PPK95038.1 O-antigen/teichoic acid export membrane protein [Nonlabens xylanidelens]PQJ17575.1 sugar isomerase [Nonlabens xylanidelens]
MLAITQRLRNNITQEQLFMLSAFIVNGGNYFYNLMLGRYLGPTQFADAAILITLLLVLSFIAMTFQLTVTKVTVEFAPEQKKSFIAKIYKYAIGTGLFLGMITVGFAGGLKDIFQTQSSGMFVAFGMAIPLYFIMSINRGVLQGENNFFNLSITYQTEMLCRLLLTFSLLLLVDLPSEYAVSIAIGVSFIAGLFPLNRNSKNTSPAIIISKTEQKRILLFFILTACYELTQIVCNNSDILLVKHYFPSYDAGLYASLALIGRVVYFVTWMFVMLLLPKVLQNRKEGKDAVPVLKKFVGYITALSLVIVGFTFIFPTTAVYLLFGEDYVSIAPLLGWYALATSFFALANIFAYYFLSLDHYKPIVITAIFGALQVVTIILFHDSLLQVVMDQVYVMAGLLIAQLCYFSKEQHRAKKA